MEYAWIDLSPLSLDQKESLLAYLESYLSGRRSALFDAVLDQRTRHFTLAVEDTYQEHNASALIRTCDCFGIQEMHVIEKYHAFRIAKGMAKGADKWVDVQFYEEENNIEGCINHLRTNGYRIVATTPHRDQAPLEDFDIHPKSALFFGREKEGLSQQIIDQADAFVTIPMVGFTESFNISVSAAIILNTITAKLRRSTSIDWKLSKRDKLDKKIEWSLKTINNAETVFKNFLRESGI